MARPEADIVACAPIVVILGGEKYEIKPLVIRDSRPWRLKVLPFLKPLPKPKKVDMLGSFEVALNEMLITMPNTVLDLFFEYAKALDREKIEAVATEAEVLEAFSEIVAVAFPLSQSLPRAMGILSR